MFERLLTRFSAGFVVAFHDIPAERAEQFIEALHPARPIPLDEMVERAGNGKTTAGLFAITIDDGVGETVRSLSRLFETRQWPATFYLPTGYIDNGEGMVFQWWRAIRPLLPRRKIELKSETLDFSAPGAIEELSKKMERRWHAGRLESYRPVTMDLVEFVTRDRGIDREEIHPPAPVTWDEVAEIAHTGLLQFESHGVTHAAMSSLNDAELEFEMRQSRDTVARHTGRACRHLAYPFGSWTSIGDRAASAAARFYDSATTMTPGHVEGANASLLPRIPLYPENPTHMARLKVLLTCTRLSRAH